MYIIFVLLINILFNNSIHLIIENIHNFMASQEDIYLLYSLKDVYHPSIEIFIFFYDLINLIIMIYMLLHVYIIILIELIYSFIFQVILNLFYLIFQYDLLQFLQSKSVYISNYFLKY